MYSAHRFLMKSKMANDISGINVIDNDDEMIFTLESHVNYNIN